MRPASRTNIQRPHAIGIVGAGGIVKAAHLPAYRTAGFTVSAIYDRDLDRAASLAAEFGIAKVCRDLAEMLDDPSIEVMDIAVPPESQSEIVMQAIGRGKHLLCQKPLARTAAEAEILVRAAEDAGVKLAVNVSMRWAPAMRETADLIRSGAIGDLVAVLFDVKYYEYWHTWPWLVASDRLVILFDMIHLFDVTRTIMGPARSVQSRYGRAQESDVTGETWADIRVDYGDNVVARFDEDSRIPPDQTAVRFRFTGSRGSSPAPWESTTSTRSKGRHAQTDSCGYGRRDGSEKELLGRWCPTPSANDGAPLASIENGFVPEQRPRSSRYLPAVDSITVRAVSRSYPTSPGSIVRRCAQSDPTCCCWCWSIRLGYGLVGHRYAQNQMGESP
jgi:predicted dehydrogenase